MREVGPTFARVVFWNEWVRGEQLSIEISKEIESSKKLPGRISELYFVLLNVGDRVELRNVKLLTPDGSRITPYEFY